LVAAARARYLKLRLVELLEGILDSDIRQRESPLSLSPSDAPVGSVFEDLLVVGFVPGNDQAGVEVGHGPAAATTYGYLLSHLSSEERCARKSSRERG